MPGAEALAPSHARGRVALMAIGLMVGAVLFANEESLLLTDRTLFVVPVGMHLPRFPVGTTVVIEYEIVEEHNVQVHAPVVRP